MAYLRSNNSQSVESRRDPRSNRFTLGSSTDPDLRLQGTVYGNQKVTLISGSPFLHHTKRVGFIQKTRICMVLPMYFRGKGALLWWIALCALSISVTGSGCQHSCDCGFSPDGGDTDVTLRYEVMSGLVGAFAPLTLAGLSFLTYKFCSRPPVGTASLPGGATSHMPTSYRNNGWRRDGRGFRGNSNPIAREPTSLYGESDDETPPQSDRHRPNHPGGRAPRPSSHNSRYTNIHRNVKTDMTNQWLRNVNLRKY
ncbi:hypothetical protein RRG08_034243 [Elysia crispata]|uniref:Uncharacterized protein n=1 Tax=Elysia crispata TaxID=231223 RepID=A0AAE1A125_9GAST|nr:hypothetical protein RRG08_034243 [Elysia crispata]